MAVCFAQAWGWRIGRKAAEQSKGWGHIACRMVSSRSGGHWPVRILGDIRDPGLSIGGLYFVGRGVRA